MKAHRIKQQFVTLDNKIVSKNQQDLQENYI